MANTTPKILDGSWQNHPSTYRAREIKILVRWIEIGASGSVVGLRGSGRSNLLGYLCHRPEVIRTYFENPAIKLILAPVDLNNVPDPTLATFYRVLLRAFYEIREELPDEFQALATQLFMENRAATDPFVPQSALRELIFHLQTEGYQVVLVIDRFDAFCRMITPELGDTLVGLQDSFRDTLSYIVGIRQSLVYLDTLELASDFMRLLTTHICYLGPLTEADARNLIERRTRSGGKLPSESEVMKMLALTGGYPTLLKAICRWWLLTPEHPPLDHWLTILANELAVQRRLHDIWEGLTQEEQQALSELQSPLRGMNPALLQRLERREEVLFSLAMRGICHQHANEWMLFGQLFQAYVQRVGALGRGAIWMDEQTRLLYHGSALLDDLTPKERAVLEFLVKHASLRHTYTDVIISAWSDEERYHGVTNDSLFQVIRGLRQKIEPDPAKPVYLVNWRGKPEGGYLFFPEGRPA